jgi:hypothetical protein
MRANAKVSRSPAKAQEIRENDAKEILTGENGSK